MNTPKNVSDQATAVAEHLPDPLFRLDRSGRIQYANRAARRLLPGANGGSGFSNGPRKPVWDLLPAELRSPVQRSISDFLQSGARKTFNALLPSTSSFDQVHLSPSPETHLTSDASEAAACEDAPGAFTLCLRERMEKERTEEHPLPQPDPHRRYLLEQTQRLAGGWIWDVAQDRIELTEETCRIHDLPAGSVLTLNEALTFYPEDTQPVVRAFIRACREDGTPFDEQLPFVTANGTRRWVRTTGEPVYEDGTVVKIAGAFQDITDAHRQEEDLRAQRKRLALALAGGNLGIWDMFFDSETTIYSPRWAEILGYTPDEVESTVDFFFDHVHPEDRERVREGVRACMDRKSEMLDIEIRMRHKSGEWIWILDRGKILEWTPDGSPKRMVGTHMDITDRKRAKDALRASEERFRALVEASAQIVWTTNADGQVVEDSPSWRAYTGQTYDEWKGWGWLDGLHPDDRMSARQKWAEAVRTGGVFDGDYRTYHAGSDTYRWMRARGLPLHDQNGAIRGWVGMNVDIHDRKMREEALLRSNIALEQAQELTATGSGVLDLTTDTFTLSEEAGVLLGLAPDTTHPFQALVDIVHPEDQERVAAEFERVRSGQRHDDVYRVYPGGNQPVRWLHGKGRPVLEPDGSIKRVFSTIRDITEERRRREELIRAKEVAEKASRLKSAFVANVSHEIRTPLTGIIGFAALLHEANLDAPYDRFVSLIQQSSERLRRTLTSVIDFSQLEVGARKIDHEPVSIRTLANEVVQEYFGQARTHGVRLECEIQPHPLRIRGDERAVRSVLGNLLSNAIKFTGDGGTVRVSAFKEERPHDDETTADDAPSAESPPEGTLLAEPSPSEASATKDWVILIVEDTGIGIEPGFLEDVFEPFQQESTGDTRTHSGSGLGLSITQHYVALLGGSISVESKKDEGTQVIVRLPLQSQS